MVYQDFPLSARVLFLQQKFGDLFPNLSGENDPQSNQEYKFRIVDYIPCNPQNFANLYFGPHLSPFSGLELNAKQSQREGLNLNENLIL